MDRLVQIDNSKIVVQHNTLINGRFNLKPTELRIFLYMLSQIKHSTKKQTGDTEFKTINVPVSFIAESIGGNSYKLIKEYQTELIKKSFDLEIVTPKGKREFIGHNIFGYCKYSEGNNFLQVKFNNEIKDYLVNIKGNFTSSEIKHLLELKNTHSFRIYWLLKQNVDFGARLIGYEDLRLMLDLKDKYSLFNNFKNKVLELAKADLADTDMSFNYELIRVGKSVGKIKFTLNKNKDNNKELVTTTVGGDLFNQPEVKVDVSAYTPEEKKLFNRLVKYQVTPEQADRVIRLSAVPFDEIHKTIIYPNIPEQRKLKGLKEHNNLGAELWQLLKPKLRSM